jgi:AraC-like DNA-binding protein
LREIYDEWDFESSRAVLIADVDLLMDRLAERDRLEKLTLEIVASHWDGTILLFRRPQAALLRRLYSSPLAARCSFVESPNREFREGLIFALSSALLSQVLAVIGGATSLARIPPRIQRAVQRLSQVQRLALRAVFSCPHAWTVKTLAAASGCSRRSLERAYSRAGLPGPSQVLELAEAEAVHAGTLGTQ